MFIVANWKANKTDPETLKWFQEFPISNFSTRVEAGQFPISNKEIIVCPSFTVLSSTKKAIEDKRLGFKVGAQDVSPFESGPYTGEVSANQIKEFADYVIIGHSERRKNFFEDEEMIIKKLTMAQKYNLTPIFCISDMNQLSIFNSQFSTLNFIVAYEPLFAIGSGKPDNPQNANNVAYEIKKELSGASVLYGGSVNSSNVKSFTSMPNINGVLVGGASLDPVEFFNIAKNA